MLDWFVVNGGVNESQLRGGLVAFSWPIFSSNLALPGSFYKRALFLARATCNGANGSHTFLSLHSASGARASLPIPGISYK